MNRLMILMMVILNTTACGIPKSMDNISSGMVDMNKRIDIMTKNTTSMEGSISKMSSSLSSTSNGIHSQALTISLNELFKAENTKYISLTSSNPIPMIPAAKAFAEIATQEELAGITYIILAEINNCQSDSMVLTKEQKDKYDLDKFIKLSGLQLIAAFVPDTVINEMIKKQIDDGGNYIESAYALITLRGIFIKDVMLDQLVSASRKLVTPAQYETALGYLETLSSIANYTFIKNLSIKIYGMYDTDNIGLNQTIQLDMNVDSLKKYYKTLSDKIETDLDIRYKTNNTKQIDVIKERIKKGL